MKQLEMVGGDQSATKPVASGGSLRNLLFVLGLVLAILGGSSGYALNQYAENMIFEIDYDHEVEVFDREVDKLTPGQLVALYDEMRIESGLGEWYEPNFVRYNTQGGYLQTFAYCLLGLSGLGVLTLLGSFFVPR